MQAMLSALALLGLLWYGRRRNGGRRRRQRRRPRYLLPLVLAVALAVTRGVVGERALTKLAGVAAVCWQLHAVASAPWTDAAAAQDQLAKRGLPVIKLFEQG